MTAMEILDSADVELDFRGFPVIPAQLGIFVTPSARVSQNIPFQQAYPKYRPEFYTEGMSILFATKMCS